MKKLTLNNLYSSHSGSSSESVFNEFKFSFVNVINSTRFSCRECSSSDDSLAIASLTCNS